MMRDITDLSLSEKNEIAQYIKRDHLEEVNRKVSVPEVKESFYTKYGKRFLDIVIALIVLIITAPINLVIMIVTFFDVGMPILFRQTRLGKNKAPFTIYKFRNMTNDTDENGELLPPSKRVTKWGRFVRKTSLDELLNFVSILNGSMSVIGPRPLRDYYAERLNNRHLTMYRVKPGLECPPLKKIDHTLSWEERFEHYCWYAEHCSLAVDVKLCFRMIALVFDRKNTDARSKAGYGGFLGYDADGKIIYTKMCPDEYVEEFCKANGFPSLETAIEAHQKSSQPKRH